MTQQEFEQRIGKEVSMEEYAIADALYMMAGDGIDKDVFCKDYKKIQNIETVKGLYDSAKFYKDRYDKLQSEKAEMVKFLLERAEELEDVKLLDKAIQMAGHAQIIRFKISNNLQLWEKDMEYIKTHLV